MLLYLSSDTQLQLSQKKVAVVIKNSSKGNFCTARSDSLNDLIVKIGVK